MGRLNPEPFREIKRRLERAGFAEISQKGSHVKFVRRVGDTVDTAIVPNKHEVPVGTLRSILNQAHITLKSGMGCPNPSYARSDLIGADARVRWQTVFVHLAFETGDKA